MYLFMAESSTIIILIGDAGLALSGTNSSPPIEVTIFSVSHGITAVRLPSASPYKCSAAQVDSGTSVVVNSGRSTKNVLPLPVPSE